jgi:hypothetical protein
MPVVAVLNDESNLGEILAAMKAYGVVQAKALLDALDALNRALDRIRIGESRKTLH